MIESNYSPDVYTGNGSATSFAYGNKITDSSQLKVTLFTIADESEEVLILDTDYSVSGVGEDAGGSITYPISGSPMASTHKLIIERVTAPLQETDFEEQGGFHAATHEDAFDKVTAILQEHGEKLERAALATVESGESGSDIIASITAAKVAAQAAQAAAETAETNAETAETNAETAETNAEAAQAAAEAAQTAAEAAQTAAEAAQTAAEAAQAAAATSATNAATSATAAQTAETNAETAETNAETAEANAETAEANAEAAQAAAEAAQAAAETAQAASEAAAAKLSGTSTSSVAIATGSKAFTTQAGKSFEVGRWLLITSDADPANYMHGQVTAYSGTSLTVNVTNVGGSGTLADWTITVSGTRGAEGPAIDFSDITETVVMNSKAINEAKGSDIASATTTDIGAATGNFVDVTGTTTITGLGTVQAGTRRKVRFTGALTLTHHATALILPTGANITTAAGDTADFISLGSGNWVCTNYQRKDGTPLAGGLTVKTGSFTRALTTASGTQAITGVGFTPKAVIFLGVRDGGLLDTKGFDTGVAANCILQGYDSNQFLGAAYSIYFYHGSGVDRQRALITSLDADGFTLTWTKDGSPTGTGTMLYLAIK